jgi:hypothetical protein
MAKKQAASSKPVAVAEMPVTETRKKDDFIPLSSITFSPGLDGGCEIGVWSLSATWGFEFET